MDMKPRLGLRMHQQLVMTPRLQMALKILQVSTLELEQFLKQELLQNPLLERLEEDDETEECSESSEEERASDGESGGDDAKGEESGAEPEKPDTQDEPEPTADDLDWDDYLDDVYSHAYGQNLARDDDERYERVPVAVATFEDELKHQLHMERSDSILVGVAEYIIDELDEEGYVRDSLTEIAESLKVDVEIVKAALAIVQSLDPAGIGATNIEECLLLQLRRKGEGDGLAARVVEQCFEELKACRYDQIRRRLASSASR